MRKTKLSDEMAKVAAKWWADRLREGAKLDNADPSRAGGMAFMMGKIMQSRLAQERTLEQVQLFEDILYEKLLDLKYFWVGVDYHPIAIFTEAAEEAGFQLSMSCLPWKTNMYFKENGEVSVSYGYGATPKTILEPQREETK